jgi:hypothetical protein
MSLVITTNIILAAITFAAVVGMLAWNIRSQRPRLAAHVASANARRSHSRARRPAGSLAGRGLGAAD